MRQGEWRLCGRGLTGPIHAARCMVQRAAEGGGSLVPLMSQPEVLVCACIMLHPLITCPFAHGSLPASGAKARRELTFYRRTCSGAMLKLQQ